MDAMVAAPQMFTTQAQNRNGIALQLVLATMISNLLPSTTTTHENKKSNKQIRRA